MTDQCTHCTLKGDYEKCTSTPCFHHEDWIDTQRITRLAESERKLTACRDALKACHKNMGIGIYAQYYKLRLALEGIFETKF